MYAQWDVVLWGSGLTAQALHIPQDHDKQKPIKALRKPPSRATLMHRPVTQYLPPDSKYPLPVIHTVDTEKAQARQRDRKRAAERKRVVEKVQFSGGDEDEDEDEPQARDPTAEDNMVDRLDSEEQVRFVPRA